MARKTRKTENNSIVIVCEGTDTEVKYFEDLSKYVKTNYPDRFSVIRIVPTRQELTETTNRNKKKRRFKREVERWSYYVKNETNGDLYNQYCAQPTRYVREAQLFLSEDNFGEAWAVYDFDNFPDHRNAKELAEEDENLHIAFSSISFEEWILLHFERNPKQFEKSVCKVDRNDILCGTSQHTNDCHGSRCIGGRLRENNYIRDYAKSMNSLFDLLKDRHSLALVNAAWSRSLHNGHELWESNPVSTVDALTSRLLGIDITYKWFKNGDSINIGRDSLIFGNNKIENIGTQRSIIRYYEYDKFMQQLDYHHTIPIEPLDFAEVTLREDTAYVGIEYNSTIFITEA